MARGFYIVAYDISDPYRLRRVRNVVRDYATGGQKSAYECFLTNAERRELMQRAKLEINTKSDRFYCIKIRRNTEPLLMGVAVKPLDPCFCYIG